MEHGYRSIGSGLVAPMPNVAMNVLETPLNDLKLSMVTDLGLMDILVGFNPDFKVHICPNPESPSLIAIIDRNSTDVPVIGIHATLRCAPKRAGFHH